MQHLSHGGNIYHHSIRLDYSVNINPLGAPESVKSAVLSEAADPSRYPDPECSALRDALGEKLSRRNVLPEMILFGNGASELIMSICGMLARDQAGPVLISAPAFSEYERCALAQGLTLRFAPVPVFEEKEWEDTFLSQITPGLSAVFLCNPNNPTGRLYPEAFLKKALQLCETCDICLVVDECFLELSAPDRTLLSLCRDHQKLIILRSFTKTYAIPSLRLGYLVTGSASLRQRLSDLTPCWNVNPMAQAAGIAALGESGFVEKSCQQIHAGREQLLAALSGPDLRHLIRRIAPSDADFLLLETAREIRQPLLKQGILVRDCADYRNLPPLCYRIAVRTEAENTILLDALRSL